MKIGSLLATALLVIVPAAFVGCAENVTTAPEGPQLALGTSAAKAGVPGAASERTFLKAQLSPLGDSRARGTVMLEIVGGHLTARLHANGVEPSQHIPQHIHVNPTCDPGGAILINLDENLTVAGEASAIGESFPLANLAGVVKYQASRPLTELMAAVNTHFGTSLETVDELIAWLDLENRNAHMHVAFGPPFPAVNCGAIERIN